MYSSRKCIHASPLLATRRERSSLRGGWNLSLVPSTTPSAHPSGPEPCLCQPALALLRCRRAHHRSLAVKFLIYELKSDGDDSLFSWYLDNNLKVLDVCNCIYFEIERLCLRHLGWRNAMKLLCSEGKPSEEEIHQVRDMLADLEGAGVGDIKELIRDLAASTGMLALQEKVSPVDKVVCRAIQAVNFLSAFVAEVLSSVSCSSSGAVIGLRVPEEFPWGDSVCAIGSIIIVELRCGKEWDRKTRVLKELDDAEAQDHCLRSHQS